MDDILKTLNKAIAASFPGLNGYEAALERPRDRSHGDYATNAALVLSKKLGKSPREIADTIVAALDFSPSFVEKTEIAGPGFINFTFSAGHLQRQVAEILAQGPAYGRQDWGGGKKVLLEFVSANPVGPLHVGHGRWAAVGDCLGNMLDACGFSVCREFYLNDRGRQMELFAQSLEARYASLLAKPMEFPSDGYHGDYLKELAREIFDEFGGSLWEPADTRRERLKSEGYSRMVKQISESLERFGVVYDMWFSEASLYVKGQVGQLLDALEAKKEAYRKDGALWLSTTKYGDDKDRVLIRDNGEPTYFASDICYHQDKLDRGYGHLINVWGADHHGYINRVKASLQALGYPADTLEVLTGQLVNLLRKGEPVRMSKRSGEMVTFDELVEEVGPDATRFIFLSRSLDTPLDFDIELAKEQSSENPVYYVQYAHARISGILREAAERGQRALPVEQADLTLLVHPAERDLIDYLSRFPESLAEAAIKRAPQNMVRYAALLAENFHAFYTQCRVLGADSSELTQARLQLVAASGQVLRNTLAIMGVSAPEKM